MANITSIDTNKMIILLDGGIVIENTIREFKIISINPPKHFSVDLVDVKSMDIYKNQGQSKHCNNHTKFDICDLIKI